MPKKSGRKRKSVFGKYMRGSISEELDLGTLAAKTLVAQAFDEVVVEVTRVSSIEVVASLRDFTPAVDVGPILIGVAHSDYTAAEIEEYLENTGSWNRGDQINQEISKRLIRRLGIFDIHLPSTSPQFQAMVLNNGRPLKVKLNWKLVTGQSLDLWGYNLGAAAIATTTPVVALEGHANLWSV